MKPLMIVGIILIVLGAIGLAVQTISYTTQEDVIDSDILDLEVSQRETSPFPLYAGGAAVVAGIVLVVVAARRH